MPFPHRRSGEPSDARIRPSLPPSVRDHYVVPHPVAGFDDWLIALPGGHGSDVAANERYRLVSPCTLLGPAVPPEFWGWRCHRRAAGVRIRHQLGAIHQGCRWFFWQHARIRRRDGVHAGSRVPWHCHVRLAACATPDAFFCDLYGRVRRIDVGILDPRRQFLAADASGRSYGKRPIRRRQLSASHLQPRHALGHGAHGSGGAGDQPVRDWRYQCVVHPERAQCRVLQAILAAGDRPRDHHHAAANLSGRRERQVRVCGSAGERRRDRGLVEHERAWHLGTVGPGRLAGQIEAAQRLVAGHSGRAAFSRDRSLRSAR